MRDRVFALTLVSLSALVTSYPALVLAQGAAPADSTQQRKVCPPVRWRERQSSSGPEVSIAGLSFSGFLQIPVSDQEEIGASIERRKYRGSLDEVRGQIQDTVKIEWQNRGYFKADASVDADFVNGDPAKEQIAVAVHVEEGPRYLLGGITFANNRAISDKEALRNLFPLKDGAVFDREEIAKGLENLRKAYGEFGYINFVGFPDTKFDDDKKLIHLEINIDEGKQFHVSSIKIVGADPTKLQDLALTPGQVYNARLVDLFLQNDLPGAEANDPSVLRRVLNERKGTVALTFYFIPCPNE